MKTLKIFFMALLAMSVLSLNSCDSDDDEVSEPPSAELGQMKIKFDHVWGPTLAPFELNQEYSHPGTGEDITFTKLRYYISNVVLQNSNGSEWAAPESYYIVDAMESDPYISITGVPSGSYTGISYLVGVDSTRNVSGAQTGALDPAENMFWSWNTGYIFIKAEGTSPQAGSGSVFSYHLGGFSGPTSALFQNNHQFTNATLDVAVNANPEVHLFVNAARFWHGGISLQDVYAVHMPSSGASNLAANFTGGFQFDHIHN